MDYKFEVSEQGEELVLGAAYVEEVSGDVQGGLAYLPGCEGGLSGRCIKGNAEEFKGCAGSYG